MKEAALWYAERGFSVFPLYEPVVGVPSQYVDDATRTKPFKWACSCPRGAMCGHVGKHPRTTNGLHAATADAQQISDWWDANPLANIGIRTGPGSNLLIVDSDPRNGGPDSLAGMGEALGHALPDTAAVRTGSGGIHAYYRSTGDRCAKNAPGTGIDFKRGGGYVVAPPSLHGCGERYEWDGMSDREALAAELADAPAWLEDKARPVSIAAEIMPAGDGDKVEAFPPGERNVRMTSLAGYWRSKGARQHELLALLRAINKVQCHPPLADSEIVHIANSVSRYEPVERPAAPADASAAWRELEPLGPPHPSDLALDMFPSGWFTDMVQAVTLNTETPIGLGGMVALGVVSGAIAGKVRVIPFEGDYREHANLYIVVAMPPATRKSPVFSRLKMPIVAFEQKIQEQMEPVIKRLTRERRMALAEIERLERKAGKGGDGDIVSKLKLVEELEANMPDVPKLPELTCQDITPEALAIHLQDHGERTILLSAEGGVFDAITGTRWASAGNLDLLCQAYSHEDVKIKRKAMDSPPVSLKHPCLTIVVCTQPFKVLGMNDKEGVREQGVMGRFLYCIPPSRLGDRKMKSKPIPAEVSAAWNNAITALLEMMPEEEITLVLSKEARVIWHQLELDQDAAMKEDIGAQEMISDWAGKLPGNALRIAAAFHCCLHLDKTPIRTEVQAATMQAAVNLCRALIPHAFMALKVDERKPEMLRAKKLLPWIKQQAREGSNFKATDCQVENRRAAGTKEELIAALDCLENRGYIRQVGYAGRKDSAVWAVNPAVLELGK